MIHALSRRPGGLTPRQSGVATVEFAIGAPVLFFLMLAIVEIGRAFVQYAVLSNAVRNAARYLAVEAINGSTGTVVLTAQDISQTQNLVVNGTTGTGTAILPGLAPGQVTVTNNGGGMITVAAAYPYIPLGGPTLPTFGSGTGPITLTFNMTVSITLRATG